MPIDVSEVRKILSEWKSGYEIEDAVPNVCESYVTLYSHPLKISHPFERRLAENIMHSYEVRYNVNMILRKDEPYRKHAPLSLVDVDSIGGGNAPIKYDKTQVVFIATCSTIEMLKCAINDLRSLKEEFDIKLKQIGN